MDDNLEVTPGTGNTKIVAADNINGVLYQRVKPVIGADGEAIDLDGGQAAMAASLPVVIASDQTAVPVSDGGGALTVDGAVTVSGTVTASGPLTDTQLRASAVPVSDGGGVLTVDGTVAVTSANLTTIAGAVAGAEMQVDVVSSALPTGAATSANQTNGTQKTMLVDATGAEMDLFKSGDNFAVGGDHGLLTLGVSGEVPSKYRPIKVDADGHNQVDVLSLPTVTANATLAAETTKVIGTVNVAAGQTIAATQSGTWNVATVTAVTGITNALPAGDNNIGNVDLASAIPAGTNAIGTVKVTQITESYAPVNSHSSGADISTATTLTKPGGAAQIIIQAIGQNVRFTLDGTTPTGSVGFQILAGSAPMILAVPGASIKVIQEAATASLQYQWVS